MTVVTLSRNFGHQHAIGAGLAQASGDAVIVCDADLQDPPELMAQMVDLWREGADVVYAVRSSRQGSLMRRAAYRLFYRLLNSVSELDIPADCGDFSLMDRKVVDAIVALPERNRFVRGLRAWVGFVQIPLQYRRADRQLGKTKYSFARLLRLAFDGIFDFSTKPLTFIFFIGLVSSVLSLAGFVFFLAHRFIGALRFWGIRRRRFPASPALYWRCSFSVACSCWRPVCLENILVAFFYRDGEASSVLYRQVH